MRGFSRADFKSHLDVIVSAFCAQRRKNISVIAFLPTKKISVNVRD